jgi:hypothetical protein
LNSTLSTGACVAPSITDTPVMLAVQLVASPVPTVPGVQCTSSDGVNAVPLLPLNVNDGEVKLGV